MYSPIISTNPKIMSDEIQRLKDGSAIMNDSIQNLQEKTGTLGAKNIIPLPYYRSSPSVSNGVTYSYGEDGIITASGTATGTSNFYITPVVYDGCLTLKPGKYIVSMPNTKGVTLRVGTTDSLGTVTNIAVLDGTSEYELNVTDISLHYNFIIQTITGTALGETGIKLKPMLRLGSDESSTYEPYAKTNRELTLDLSKLLCNQTTAGTYKLQATVAADGSVTYEWVEVV